MGRGERALCILCGGEKTRPYQSVEGPSQVVQCTSCDLVFVHPQPSSDTLTAHYDGAYYAEWVGSQAAAREKLWRRRLRAVTAVRNRGDLLDVGCGDGGFLRAAQREGFTVSGTEISPFAAERVRHLCIPLYQGPLEEASFPPGSFDIVTLWHVLEHMSDPLRALRKAHTLLRDQGVLFVAVPNLENTPAQLLYRMVKGHPLPLYTPEGKEPHLYHFTPTTLTLLLGKAGFTPERIGPDLAQVTWEHRLVEILSVLISATFRKRLYDSLLVRAAKRGATP